MSESVLYQSKGSGQVWWNCPGCKQPHAVTVNGANPETKVPNCWGWNGDYVKPTFTPSVLCKSQIRCHCFVRDGSIQFLDDCDHELKGQTVPMEAWKGFDV